MAEPYADADPDEIVTVLNVGTMSLRDAVRRRGAALEATRGTTHIPIETVAREAGKDPGSFLPADLDRLAELERFR